MQLVEQAEPNRPLWGKGLLVALASVVIVVWGGHSLLLPDRAAQAGSVSGQPGGAAPSKSSAGAPLVQAKTEDTEPIVQAIWPVAGVNVP